MGKESSDPFSPEGLPPLSIGAIYGGTSPSSDEWRAAIRQMSRAIATVNDEDEGDFKLNVIFQVPGQILTPEFTGVRTGHYSRKHAALIVQVALPEDAPDDIGAFVRTAVEDAIDAAEPLAQRRAKVPDMQLQRDILTAAIDLIEQSSL